MKKYLQVCISGYKNVGRVKSFHLSFFKKTNVWVGVGNVDNMYYINFFFKSKTATTNSFFSIASNRLIVQKLFIKI